MGNSYLKRYIVDFPAMFDDTKKEVFAVLASKTPIFCGVNPGRS
jgi:hypothetical protein